MCHTSLRPALPPRWMRALEIVGGIIIIALIIGAIALLRSRPAAPADTAVALANPGAMTGMGQLALGGTATTIPTFTITPIPPTATITPSATPTSDIAQLTPPPGTPAPQTGGSPTVNRQSYIIAEGDTLLAIAIRFNVTLEDLLKANNFANPNVMIHPGDAIRLPGNTDTAAADAPAPPTGTPAPTSPPAVGKPTDAPTDKPAADEPQVIGRKVYIVKAGDSLWTISQRIGVSVDDLMQYNGFEPNKYGLGIGQEVVIDPGVTTTPIPPTATAAPPTATQAPPPTLTPKPTFTTAPSPTSQPTAIALAPTAKADAGGGSAGGAAPAGATAVPAGSGAAGAAAAAGGATAGSSDTVSASKYPSPVLLGPPDGSTVQGKTSPLLLNWTSVGILAPDEYYVVRVSTTRDGKPYTEQAWVKATGWRVSDSLRPPDKSADPSTYTWDVTVRKCETRGPDGQPLSGAALSPTSDQSHFTWTP
ncbi:MAG: LysM peptidoglycan-binding domain-containing protein [Anaerolineae bacterium]